MVDSIGVVCVPGFSRPHGFIPPSVAVRTSINHPDVRSDSVRITSASAERPLEEQQLSHLLLCVFWRPQAGSLR